MPIYRYSQPEWYRDRLSYHLGKCRGSLQKGLLHQEEEGITQGCLTWIKIGPMSLVF